MTGTRQGFSLIEVVVAMVLLSVILVSLAGFTFATAQQARLVADANIRAGIASELVNHYATVPFSSITNRDDTIQMKEGVSATTYQRRATVASAGGGLEITIVVRRQGGTDSTVARVSRVDLVTVNPFCMSGNCP